MHACIETVVLLAANAVFSIQNDVCHTKVFTVRKLIDKLTFAGLGGIEFMIHHSISAGIKGAYGPEWHP